MPQSVGTASILPGRIPVSPYAARSFKNETVSGKIQSLSTRTAKLALGYIILAVLDPSTLA